MVAETKIAKPGPGDTIVRAREAVDEAALVVRMVRDLRHFDVLGMEDVVAISAWGRSASLLLTSFLDGHDHVVMLPGLYSERIWRFFDQHADLPLKERLLAYPAYSERQGRPFHYGDFIVPEAEYRAAVDALLAVHGALPLAVLGTRRAFFQFLHAAYALAQGKCPATPRPLMVYFQHNWDEAIAARLVAEFPKARFIHTVRHPIACFRSSVERHLSISMSDGQVPQPAYFKPVLAIATELLTQDRPHPGSAARTIAVRFEDMHLHPDETMRAVATWLGLPWRRALGVSTFNGIPYLMERGDTDWVGAQPTQVQNPMRGVSFVDRTLLFALFHENFAAWGYPHPAIFRYGWARRLAVLAFRAIPMSMELMVARASWRVQFRPAFRSGAYGFVLRLTARWVACHGAAARVATTELRERLGRKSPWGRGPELLQILHPEPASSPPALAVARSKVARKRRLDADGLAAAVLDRYGMIRAAAGSRPVFGQSHGADDAPADPDPVAQAAALLDPIVRRIRAHVFAAEMLHAADLPVPVLIQTARGRTQARVWAYVRDDRPFRGEAAPAVALFYSPDRAPAHRQDHLAGFFGFLQTHAGPAFERPADGEGLGGVEAVACWGRCRLKFCELVEFSGATQAAEALDRIAAIQAIETRARGLPIAERLALRARARPLVENFFGWAETVAGKLDGTSALVAAFRYALARRSALSRFLDHGGLEFDNAATEPVMSRLAWDAAAWVAPAGGADPAALVDQGSASAAVYSVIASARLNALDEQVYLRDVLAALKQPRGGGDLERLLPWHWTPRSSD